MLTRGGMKMTNDQSKPKGKPVEREFFADKAIARAKPAGSQPAIPQPTKAKSK